MKLSQHVSVGGHSTKHNLVNSYRAELDHVDPSLSDGNITLRSDGLQAVYSELFDDAVKEYNDKQKRKSRKIGDYYEKVRDDARGRKGVQNKDGKRLAYEQVVGIGNRDTFHASNPANIELAKAVFGEYVDKFEKKFPQLRVFEAVIHVDETEGGIHLHNAYVPWGEGYSQGMSRQQSLSKACENMGFDHKELDTKSKQLLEEVCLRHGIERLDMGNTEHHKPTAQFKREQRELEQIRAQKDRERGEHFKQQKVLSAKRHAAEREARLAQAQKTVMKKNVRNMSAVKRTLTAEVVELRSEVIRETEALAYVHEKLAQEQELFSIIHEALTSETERLDSVVGEIKEKKVELSSLDSCIVEQQEKIAELHYEIFEMAGEAATLRLGIDALKEENAALETTRNTLKDEISEMKVERGVIESAIEALKATFNALVEKIARYMPEPLRQLARYWRDGNMDGVDAWHEDMDFFAQEIVPELPTRFAEDMEAAIAAASERSYGFQRERDDWDGFNR